MSSNWIRVSPNFNPTYCSYKRRRYTEIQTSQKKVGHMKTEAVSDAPASQGMPRIAGSHQKQGRGKGRSFPKAFRGDYGSTDTLISDM